MKILSLGFFDPASVSLGHRDAFRAIGVDYRVAIHRAVTPRHLKADWVFEAFECWEPTANGLRAKLSPQRCDTNSLIEFALDADVIQVHPGIGDGSGAWADAPQLFAPDHGLDPPAAELLHLSWLQIRRNARARWVAYFHGSINAWANAEKYAAHYSKARYALATSTLDYAERLKIAYLPPSVRVDLPPAALRGPDDPLVIAHTPTNKAIASTDDFLRICGEQGAVAKVVHMRPREDAIAAKRAAHAVFDHLRGSFSVNTLEGCALGCVPLVGLSPACAARLEAEGIDPLPGPALHDVAGLARGIRDLANSPEYTSALQLAADRWFTTHFRPTKIAGRLLRFYKTL